MLNTLRESAGSWLVKILLGLLIISFAAWGINDVFTFRPDADVATVGDRGISGPAFLDRFDRQVRDLRRQFGPSFDQEQARRLGFADRVLDQMITQTLYDEQAEELDLIASDAEARRQIQLNPAFRDSLGNFSRLEFENRLASIQQSEQGFVAILKQAIMRNQLLEAATFAADSPTVMVDAIYRYQNEMRVLDVLAIQSDAMTASGQPSEDAIASYYRENESDFMAPEYRELTYLTLTADDVAGDMAVSENELQEAYESRLAEFTKEETRTVDQIVVQDEAVALAIVDRLKQGGDFYAVAKELADADRDAVSLGNMRRDEMPDAIGDPVFALEAGAIGGPVQSPFGWHVFRVTEISEGGRQSLADVKQQLLEGLQYEKAVDEIYDLSIRIEDMLAGGAKLEEIAETLGLTHGRVAAVDASGRNRDEQPAEGLPSIPGLLATAFNTEIGEDLALQEAASGAYYLVRVDSITPSALRPLDDVRGHIVERLTELEKETLARAEAERIMAAARNGQPLSEFAGADGYSVMTTQPLIRTQSQSQANLSADLARDVYDLQSGGVTSGPSRDGSAYLVVKVREIQPAAAGENAPGRVQTRQVLTQSISEDLLEQFTAALHEKFKVEKHHAQINALFDEDLARR